MASNFLRIKKLNLKLLEFYGKFGTLPPQEEKEIIGLFRFYLGFDNFYEEVNQLKLAQILAKDKAQEMKTSETTLLEEKINEMEIEGFENLPKLFVSQTEKMMDKFNGSVKELRGLFKIPKTNIQTGS